jgi:hypothetical protein
MKKQKLQRFLLEPSAEHPNHWVLTDKKHGVVCVFEDKKFNDTQKFTMLNNTHVDKNTACRLASILNEMASWLLANHSEKALF